MQILSPSSVLLRTQSDERLVTLARAGHERAFEAIVERYRGTLLRAARRYLPEARAEDALQQAYISAWSAIGRGDEVRDLRAWLYRIVHNTALNQLRVSGYDYSELDEALRGAGAPEEEMERRAIVRQTLTGLAALPERQREALLRIAVEGRSQEEVARELGVSEGAVRQLVHRARLTLRAAATAVTPLPLATYAAGAAASSGAVSTSMAERITEMIGGAGASAFLAKAGAVAVLATGTAVAVPKITPSDADPVPRVERTASPTVTVAPTRTVSARPTAEAAATPAQHGERVEARPRTRAVERPRRIAKIMATPAPTRTPAPTVVAAPKSEPRSTDDPSPSHTESSNSGSGSSNSGSGSSNSGPGSTSSGSGSSGSSGSSRSDDSGHSGSDDSGSSNSGSGSSNSGPGSDSSGSGSSGSGSSGSGSTPGGSGTSGGSGSVDDTSGSGSSGSNSGPGSSGGGSGSSGHGGGSSTGRGGGNDDVPTPTATPSA